MSESGGGTASGGGTNRSAGGCARRTACRRPRHLQRSTPRCPLCDCTGGDRGAAPARRVDRGRGLTRRLRTDGHRRRDHGHPRGSVRHHGEPWRIEVPGEGLQSRRAIVEAGAARRRVAAGWALDGVRRDLPSARRARRTRDPSRRTRRCTSARRPTRCGARTRRMDPGAIAPPEGDTPGARA